MRQRIPFFGWVGRLDDEIYKVERVIVVGSLIIMTFGSFLKILADFLSKYDEPSAIAVVYAIAFFIFALIGRVSAVASPELIGNRMMHNIVALIWGLFAAFYFWMIHASTLTLATLERHNGGPLVAWSYPWLVGKISSSVVIAFHICIAMGMLIYYEFRRPRDLSEPMTNPRSVSIIATMLVAWAGMLYIAAQVGFGYSWGPKISLTLLLWMAFMGASMATHQRAHLSIDAIRKLVPQGWTRRFNAASYLLAAIFTGAFFYLSYIYLLNEIGDAATASGDIPDWFKVLSIPVALFMITIRFTCYAFADLIGAILKVEPDPELDATEVAS